MTTYTPAINQRGSSDGTTWTPSASPTVSLTTIGGARFGPLTFTRNELVTACTLTLTTLQGEDAELVFYGVPSKPTLDAWATSNLPQGKRRYELARVNQAAPGATLTVSLNPTGLLTLQRSEAWNGFFSLIFTASTSALMNLTAMSVGTTAAGFAPSLQDVGDKQSRPDFCARCGDAIWREDLVRDGYTKTLVCADCYDPPEVPIPSSRPPRRLVNN